LTKYKENVEKVAKLLLEKEMITREDMYNLLGRRVSGSEHVIFLGSVQDC